jgi:transcriptional regulator with XRE-family HTH domain
MRQLGAAYRERPVPWRGGHFVVDADRSMSSCNPGSASAQEDEPATSAGSSDRYAKALGTRLRAVRNQQQLSLIAVEKKSRGRWKAVVVGSYERGDRAVSVRKLSELADFYGVAVSELLPSDHAGAARTAPRQSRNVLDLDKVRSLTDPNAETLKRFVVSIQGRRGAMHSRTLGVRQEDLHALALMYDCTVAALTARLHRWQVLSPQRVIIDDLP